MKFKLLQRVPAAVREAIYEVLTAAFIVETTLDRFDKGVVPSDVQEVVVAVLASLGLTLAASNITKSED